MSVNLLGLGARHNKQTGRTYVRPDDCKYLHYYFYVIDEELGLCFVRVPIWCPFRLQFYFNGHNWLARQSKKSAAACCIMSLLTWRDFAAAQQLADSWDPFRLHCKLDAFAARYCPVLQHIEKLHHWSLD